jgi:hypothetical protein
MKNHAEYLEEALLLLINDYEDSIMLQISRSINLDDILRDEEQKQTIFTDGYERLLKLKSSVVQGLGI